ncbi:hypothetical protein OIU74_026278 [Salix koriyanagi]|uniref:Uncharacterized protein n=1 Tax=Salix koriyanagi TaxID=2511006 RepID=A0A9Q1A3W8_9ROSI|nr:hypothetical protein OIU74_026278 [Salix koriyanagi]
MIDSSEEKKSRKSTSRRVCGRLTMHLATMYDETLKNICALCFVKYWPLEHVQWKLHQVYEHYAHGGYKPKSPSL